LDSAKQFTVTSHIKTADGSLKEIRLGDILLLNPECEVASHLISGFGLA